MRIILLILAMLVVASFPFMSDWMSKNKTNSGYDEGYIEKAIDDYVKDHPDRILMAVQKYSQSKEEDMRKEFYKKALEENSDVIQDDRYPYVGSDHSTIKVVEFFDYSCAYCKRMVNIIDEVIKDNDVKYMFREIPLLNGRGSDIAAEAALAVNMIDRSKYWGFHKAMLSHNSAYDNDVIEKIISEIGVDVEEFKRVKESQEIKHMIDDSKKLFINLGMNGTPAFIIGNEVIVGGIDLATFQNKIDAHKK